MLVNVEPGLSARRVKIPFSTPTLARESCNGYS